MGLFAQMREVEIPVSGPADFGAFIEELIGRPAKGQGGSGGDCGEENPKERV
jgi:hypothetical protein